MPNGSSILIVGAGDLGLRIALRCAAATGIHRVWLAGRNPARGHIDARLIDACSVGAMVAFRHVDAFAGFAQFSIRDVAMIRHRAL